MGEWRTLQLDWARPVPVVCRLCGRPLFGRVWSGDASGEPADFCDNDCEGLFREYWLPRYGDPAPPDG